MELDTLYRRTVESWNEQVRRVGADQWDLPTPCSDWTVRGLVNHVTGEDLWTVPLLDGSTIEEVGDRFDGDLLGDDPGGVALRAADDAASAVAERLPAGGTVQLSYGEERLEEYVAQLAADHLVHGWDLAAAIGGPPRLDPDVVAGVASWFADREELYRSVGAIGPRAGTHDDPQDDLIAGFGRDPSWRVP
ncbi:TIGR03086 family metal-binding protein [Nocardioides pocheonensis]|uniref:TIGR03086 family protein n=1 Tax=Nocardioides pocheonensis TaxID=661485 RepID=A0A3N0GMU9_9ACTN|nr:TIGR03086 family metal-binding protein [Nocardioides pocheonensis]RNM13783.1 TIGR03086 family protein [Nocardioides pocheonensis]